MSTDPASTPQLAQLPTSAQQTPEAAVFVKYTLYALIGALALLGVLHLISSYRRRQLSEQLQARRRERASRGEQEGPSRAPKAPPRTHVIVEMPDDSICTAYVLQGDFRPEKALQEGRAQEEGRARGERRPEDLPV